MPCAEYSVIFEISGFSKFSAQLGETNSQSDYRPEDRPFNQHHGLELSFEVQVGVIEEPVDKHDVGVRSGSPREFHHIHPGT
jgi:hypothetical protein